MFKLVYENLFQHSKTIKIKFETEVSNGLEISLKCLEMLQGHNDPVWNLSILKTLDNFEFINKVYSRDSFQC